MVGLDPVQSTNDDAQISKLSCVKLGYFKDDFLHHFVHRGSRRAPLINRGYYSRVAALRDLLQQFLSDMVPASAKQVLVLGAGFDTNWFQLKAEGKAPARYIEVDFSEVTRKKAAIIARTPELHHHLPLSSPDAIDPDLRDLPGLVAGLERAGLDPELPTYVLSECVLVYLDPRDSAALVRHLGQVLTTAVFVVYEQIHPDDAFGRQMLINLESRGLALRGIHATPDLEAHRARFTANGWPTADAKDMDTIYKLHLHPADKQRIERIEIFDEFEQWHMIQEHYCITIGKRDAQGLLEKLGFRQYKAAAPPRWLPDAG